MSVPLSECRACNREHVHTEENDNLCEECFKLREESIAADIDKVEKEERDPDFHSMTQL